MSLNTLLNQNIINYAMNHWTDTNWVTTYLLGNCGTGKERDIIDDDKKSKVMECSQCSGEQNHVTVHWQTLGGCAVQVIPKSHETLDAQASVYEWGVLLNWWTIMVNVLMSGHMVSVMITRVDLIFFSFLFNHHLVRPRTFYYSPHFSTMTSIPVETSMT